MKLRIIVIATAVVLFTAINSSQATTLSPEDSSRIFALHNRMTGFSANLGQIMKSMARSGASGELFCLMAVSDQANNVNLYLYGATFVVKLASVMTDANDEMWTLANAQPALSALSGALENARSEINGIFGRCRSQLAYDQAKSLLNLTNETGNVVTPMLKRVQAALPIGLR